MEQVVVSPILLHLFFADGFSQKGSPVICFQGTMNLVSRVKGFHAVIKHEKAENAALGGRSMGARAAVVTMTERGVKNWKADTCKLSSTGSERRRER